jgi:hypothetical protein
MHSVKQLLTGSVVCAHATTPQYSPPSFPFLPSSLSHLLSAAPVSSFVGAAHKRKDLSLHADITQEVNDF